MKRFAIGAAAAALLASAGVAVALDSSMEAKAQSGTHQFYLWCTGGAEGKSVTADGANAEEAQLKAWEASDKSKCWPIWQGKVS